MESSLPGRYRIDTDDRAVRWRQTLTDVNNTTLVAESDEQILGFVNYEWLTATRRWQFYALRSGFLTVILMGMRHAWGPFHGSTGPGRTLSIQMLAQFGEILYKFIAAVELTLVLFAAPASTAGAFCLDKARGTLDRMLVTDLSSAEVVLGKLGVRLAPVLGLIACVVPLVEAIPVADSTAHRVPSGQIEGQELMDQDRGIGADLAWLQPDEIR